MRSNILTNLDGSSTQAGIPLTLHLTVRDSENNNGVYSDESNQSTSGQTWLRGYQITDANGLVTFKTIIPGWYGGRTTHIHLRVRSKYNEASSTNDGSNTTQLFFPQTILDYIDSNITPYNTKGTDSTTNANDHVYTPETKGEMELVLTGDYTNGFTSALTITLPITSA